MKKLIPAVVAVLAFACLPSDQIPGLATPTAAIQATPTSVFPTDTPPPTETPVLLNPSVTPASASTTAAGDATVTATPNLTSTVVTSTEPPATQTITATSTLASGQATLTPTLGILTFGTLPPSVPFNSMTLWNRSKAQAYISLQVTTNEGYFTIIEYPVEGQVKIKAPLGSYVYVAWVGGNKMTGSFRLTATDSLVITLFKDKVVVK